MEQKIKNILAKLTLEQKAALLQGWSSWTTLGIDKLHIPQCYLQAPGNGGVGVTYSL